MDIKYSKQAAKSLSRYDNTTKLRIILAIEKLLNTPPEGDIKSMQGYKDNRFRLRVGKYRVIYRFDTDGSIDILYIIDIDSRGGIYK